MLEKLKDFYLKLPQDILESSEEAEYNRETRRKLKKCKKIKTKITHIIKDEPTHKIFRDYIYGKYSPINIGNTDINKIISSINKNNFMKSMIYMLKQFYNDNIFKEYILSDSYDEIFEEFINSDIGEDEIEVEPEIDVKENEDNIFKYIVNIRYENNFWNIYPLYNLKKGEVTKVDKSQYPNYGNVNVNPSFKFQEKNYDMVSSIWICEFKEDELEYNNDKCKFKINGDKLIKNNCIYDMEQEGIYEIAELLEDNIDLEEAIYQENIEIKNKPIREKFYIKNNSYIYGPFEYKENNSGRGYHINKSSNDYMVKKYSLEDNKSSINIREIEVIKDYNTRNISIVYFYNKAKLVNESIDIIDKDNLLIKIKNIINSKNIGYSKKEIEGIRKNIKIIVDNSLSEERRNRIKCLIENTEITDKFIEELAGIIESLVDNKEENAIVNKILEEPKNLRKLQNYQIAECKVEDKKKELERAEKDINVKKEELKKIKLDIEKANKKNEDQIIKKQSIELKNIIDKKEKVEKELKSLVEKYNLCDEIKELMKQKEGLQKKKEEAEESYNAFRRESENRQEQLEKIEDGIREKFRRATNQYSDVAFDGMIANEILESASNWRKEKNIENFSNAIASKENIEKEITIKSFNKDSVIDYIYNKIRKIRNCYSKNDVINIMICITQGFLTVFAGEPGVGKTSLCNIIAKVLGLSDEDSNYNRYTEISVEKGWTSKRDLIGYYNPLTKSFDKNNSSLFKTFNILDKEYKNGISDFPYFILLDESNLSSMEHYWADFMNVCDLDKLNRKINLGEDYIYNIPETLRFLATINYDHTTETLSPRLIDRSWIVLLESKDLSVDNYSNLDYKDNINLNEGIIMFEDLKKCFSSYSSDHDAINPIGETLREIYDIFKNNNTSISPRIDNMIINYLKVGCNLFDATDETAAEYVALDYAVSQKLLPKINGYGDDYDVFLSKLSSKFNDNHMIKSRNIVDNIIKKGKNNMEYYQFFS